MALITKLVIISIQPEVRPPTFKLPVIVTLIVNPAVVNLITSLGVAEFTFATSNFIAWSVSACFVCGSVG